MTSNWWRVPTILRSRANNRSTMRSSRRVLERPMFRPSLELLEDRTALSQLVVQSESGSSTVTWSNSFKEFQNDQTFTNGDSHTMGFGSQGVGGGTFGFGARIVTDSADASATISPSTNFFEHSEGSAVADGTITYEIKADSPEENGKLVLVSYSTHTSTSGAGASASAVFS